MTSSKIKLGWLIVGNDVMGDMGVDMATKAGAMPAGTGEPLAGVMGERDATGDTEKLVGKAVAGVWND